MVRASYRNRWPSSRKRGDFDDGTISWRWIKAPPAPGAILFTRQGSSGSSAQIPFSQYYPQPGWVEHDPLELLDSQLRAAANAWPRAACGPVKSPGWGWPTSGKPR